MFVCLNQSCGAQWLPTEVVIKNEGQGPLFRCPLCGSRNPVMASHRADGTIEYKQRRRAPSGVDAAPPDVPRR